MRSALCFFFVATAVFTACSSDSSSNQDPKDASADTSVPSTQDGSVFPGDATVSPVDGGGTSADAGAPGTDSGQDAAKDLDAGTDANDIDASFDGSPPTDAGVDPTFTNVYAIVISGTCNGCHGAVMPSGKLNMSTKAAAYASLVGVKAAGSGCGLSGETRVVANDHTTSLLWNKVNGTQDCGARMPFGGGALSQEKIDLVASWIDTGALDN
jgi:hypothetical protein